jgi:hypothetical protein
LLTPGQVEWAKDKNLLLLPVKASRLPSVQLVGIARTKYRPHTKATAAWFARKQEWLGWQERYQQMVKAVAGEVRRLAA